MYWRLSACPRNWRRGLCCISLGRQNSVEEITYITEQLSIVADLLRKMSPLYHQYLKEVQNNA
jgi:hypothetical protein